MVKSSLAQRLVALAGIAFLCASCGGTASDDSGNPELTIDAAHVAVQAGGAPVRVRIDVRGYTDSRGITGYQTTFDEAGTGIEIDTSPCEPADAGTRWCQEWIIAAPRDTLPGEYSGRVRAFGNAVPVKLGALKVVVVSNPYLVAPPMILVAPAAIVVDGTHETTASFQAQRTLVITQDKRLWGTGSNDWGALRSASYGLTFDGDVDDFQRVQPGTFHAAVPLFGSLRLESYTGPLWTAVASHPTHTIALRDDGTVWAWGLNSLGGLGFEPDPAQGNIELTPRQVPGLAGISAISTLRSPGRRVSLALASDSTVYAWGDDLSISGEPSGIFSARQVPASIDADGVASPLTNVRAIAGGAAQNGKGSAAVVKLDGTVWTWGRDQFVNPGRPEPRQMPRQVTGLPANAKALAMTGGEQSGIGLARLDDGRVFAFPSDASAGEAAPAAEAVAGLADVVQIAAGADFAYALRGDGRVLHWQPGVDAPRLVDGLENVMSIGVAHAIVRNGCSGEAGSVWRIDAAGRIYRVEEFSADPGCSKRYEELNIVVSGNGTGAVLSQSGEVNCTADCFEFVLGDSLVHLFALPSFGVNATWSGEGCAGGVVWMTQPRTCTVTFDREEVPHKTMTVTVVGEGRVTSSVAGIDCGSDCSESWPQGTLVTLDATPAGEWVFDGYTGLADCRDGEIALGSDMTCTATFVLPQLLQVFVVGQGSVSSLPAGIDCGIDCRERFPLNAPVSLNPTPAPGWAFVRFSGDADCADYNLTMGATRSCTAHFALIVPPAAPVGLGAVATAAGVQLRWTAASDASSYELTRTPGNGGAASRTVSFAGPVDSYLDTSVASDTHYNYELVARNVAGASAAARTFVTTPVAANWTRIGADDIDQRASFSQPALALTADGNTVAVAQVFASGGLDQTQVYLNDTFTPNSWSRLAGTPGDALTPAAAGTQPAVALDRQGAAVVAWTQAGPTGNDIRVARYDSATAQWVLLGGALDTDPGNPTPLDATQPELVLDANDRPVVAWLHGGGAFVKRWDGSAWGWVAGGGGFGPNVNAVKLVLDAAGTAHLLLRRGSGSAAQLFAYREGPGSWTALGGALNSALTAPRDSLPFFDLVIDVDGSPLAVWSEGIAPHDVLASRWRNGGWQALPKLVDFEINHAITGLAAARSVQAAVIVTTPPVVMVTRQPVFAGSNPRNAYGDVYLLQNDAWTQRPSLVTFGPLFGLTLRVTRQATPVAAWLAETGATGSGELRLFVWRAF